MAGTYYHMIFEYLLASKIELPELPVCGSPPESRDKVVRFSVAGSELTVADEPSWSHHWHHTGGEVSLAFGKKTDSYYLRFPGLADFEMSIPGSEIVAYPVDNLNDFTLRHLLLDQVLPRYFAHVNHCSIFHASCVSLNGRGLVFLGRSGLGKSTLSTAFLDKGYFVLTDDCLMIRSAEEKQLVGIPSYCTIRLLPDSISSLTIRDVIDTSPVSGYSSKLRFSPHSNTDRLTTISALFVLQEPEPDNLDVSVSPIRGVDAMIRIMAETFCLDPNDSAWGAGQFERISAILNANVPLYSLTYPRVYTILPQLVETLSQYRYR